MIVANRNPQNRRFNALAGVIAFSTLILSEAPGSTLLSWQPPLDMGADVGEDTAATENVAAASGSDVPEAEIETRIVLVLEFNHDLRMLETGSPEHAVTRNYLDWVTVLPWYGPALAFRVPSGLRMLIMGSSRRRPTS